MTDQEIYDWVDAGKKEFDEAKRKAIYSNIQKKNVEQSYYMPIYYSVNFAATNINAGGIQYAPNSVSDYSYLCVAVK